MRTLVTAVVLLAVALPLAAQPATAPRDELLRLVPTDTAICLVVQGVRERSKVVSASPLAAWVSEKYRPALGAAPEMQKLKDVETLFSTFFDVTLTDLRDDIFGDAVVLTYQPGPIGKPEAEQGCVMLKARDPAKLSKLVDKLNTVQKTTKELTSVEKRTHHGQAYFQRMKADDRSEFYLLDDGLFVFAAQEASIHAVIDRQRDPTLTLSPVVKAIEQLGVQNSFLFCWFNPRKLDAEVQAHVTAAGSASEKAARRQVAQIWAALDNVAVYLDAEKDLELGFAAAYRAEAMPDEWRTLLHARPRSATMWQVIPEDALVALAARSTGRQILDAVLSFTPPEERATVRQDVERAFGAIIGKGNVPALLAGVGPDWGVWVTRPQGKSWFPAATLAVGVADDPAVRSAVAKTATFYTQLAQFSYNREHDDQIESRIERKADGPDVTVFTNPAIFPPGVRPAFGLTHGHLVVASSPEQVEAFRKPVAPKMPPEETVVLRVSGAALHAYLGEHGKAIAEWAADQQDRPLEEVRKEFANFADVLNVLDRGEVILRGDGQVLRCAVRLKFVKPLAK